MLPHLVRCAIVLALILGGAGVARAQLTIESGTAVELDPTRPGLSLQAGDQEHASIQFMVEARGLGVRGPLLVNIDTPGSYDGTTPMTSTSVAVGSVVDSTLFHFDPPGVEPEISTAELKVRFDGPVLGIIIATEDLDGSDATVRPSAPPPLYPAGEVYRGLEPVEDQLELQADGHTLQMYLGAIDFIDEVRVISMSVATPRPDASVPDLDAGERMDAGADDAGLPAEDSAAPRADAAGSGAGPSFHGSGVGCAAGGTGRFPLAVPLLLAALLVRRRST